MALVPFFVLTIDDGISLLPCLFFTLAHSFLQNPTQYFMQREEWRITDIMKNPMVMMMILPVILIG